MLEVKHLGIRLPAQEVILCMTTTFRTAPTPTPLTLRLMTAHSQRKAAGTWGLQPLRLWMSIFLPQRLHAMVLQFKNKRMTRGFHDRKYTNPVLRRRDTVLQSCRWATTLRRNMLHFPPPTRPARCHNPGDHNVNKHANLPTDLLCCETLRSAATWTIWLHFIHGKQSWTRYWMEWLRHFAGPCHGLSSDLDLSRTGLYTSIKARPQKTTLTHTDQHLFQNSFAMLSCIQIPYPLTKTHTSSFNHKWTKWKPRLHIFSMSYTKIMVFWDMTPCKLVDEYKHFGGTFCLHLDVPSNFDYLTHYTTFTS